MHLNIKGGVISIKNGNHLHRGRDMLKIARHNKQDTNLEKLKDSLQQMKISPPVGVKGKKQYVHF